MIDPHIPAFLLIGFLKKGFVAEANDWKPTRTDVLKLRDDMSKFQVKVINGKKQYPFEQHLVSKGICSFGDFGELQLISPENYRKATDTYGLHQWIEDKDQEQLFQAYPEERVAWNQKITEMFASMRKVDMTAPTGIEWIT